MVRITPASEAHLKKRALLAVFLTICVSLIGFGIVIPLLPFYAQQFQASEWQVGLLFASFSLAQLIAAPILGDWSDRWGRRPVLILSLLGSALSFVMLALAGNLFWLFASRIVDGFTGGNITTARAYIADISEPHERARNYGLIGAAFGLGFILGPALGGGLAKFGLETPAWVAAGISLLAAVLGWRWLPETVHAMPAKRPSPWRELPALMRRPLLGRLLWMDLILWSAFSVYQTTFPLFTHKRFEFGPVENGYVLAVVGLMGVLMQAMVVGRVVQATGERATLRLGLGLNVLGLMGAAFVQGVPLFLVAVCIATIGGALALPSFTSLLSQAAGADEQGRIQGVSGSLESLARIIGPVWGNGLLGYGDALPYASAALLLALVWLVALGIPKKDRASFTP
ncbi:MAG: MFS transporter [Fimbriimonadales bacterium]|nr:MFS transporter [Fimbriimonadales bacterium]